MSTHAHTTPNTLPHRAHARFSGRAAAVFGVTLAFGVMAVSGLAVYIAPAGRVATELNWHLLGLGRDNWEAIHLASSFLFMALVAWHAAAHFGFYKVCLKGTAMHPGGHKLEALLALVLVAFIALAAVMAWPPSDWAVDAGDYFKRDYWGTTVGGPVH
jgi:hypothetical protein